MTSINKKGHLTSAWQKVALAGTLVAAASTAVLPTIANAGSLQQDQRNVAMANCYTRHANEMANLYRNNYDTYQQRAARRYQIQSQFNLCTDRARVNYGGGYGQPAPQYYQPAQPAYQPPAPPTYYNNNTGSYYQPQQQVQGALGAFVGTLGAIVIGHALHRAFDHRDHRFNRFHHDYNRFRSNMRFNRHGFGRR